MLHTITYSGSLSHTIWTILIRVYFRRIHFSLQQTFIFFMDLVIFFRNLDDPRSPSCFTCGSYNHFRQSRRLSVSTSFHLLTILEWHEIFSHKMAARPQQCSSLHGKFCLNFSSGNSYEQNY